ncbi:MAG: S41 family peptidase, partial [bacterium]|nr:S41 family peptidase [bacterium]
KEKNGIPILKITQMPISERIDDSIEKEFLKYAKEFRDKEVAILDLRENKGGNSVSAVKWLEEYSKRKISTNSQRLLPLMTQEENLRNDVFIPNSSMLIILVSNNTASAAEVFLDASYNLTNVIIIGENTYGAMRSDSGNPKLKLINSEIEITYGKSLCLFPENDYFIEGRGFVPDICVPAEKAEELALKMIQYYKLQQTQTQKR